MKAKEIGKPVNWCKSCLKDKDCTRKDKCLVDDRKVAYPWLMNDLLTGWWCDEFVPYRTSDEEDY